MRPFNIFTEKHLKKEKGNHKIFNLSFKYKGAENLRLIWKFWNVNHQFQKDFRNLNSL